MLSVEEQAWVADAFVYLHGLNDKKEEKWKKEANTLKTVTTGNDKQLINLIDFKLIEIERNHC